MKFFIVTLALIAVVAAQQPEPVPVAILRQSSDSSPDGSYQFNFETENGISVSEEGRPGPDGEDGPAVVVRGEYSYTDAEGTVFTVKYVADETGFHPEGSHLPVPPEIPEAIARSLEVNAASAASSNVRRQREQPKNYGRRF